MGKALSAVALLAGLAVPSVAFAGEIHVPGDIRKLQTAVDTALPGDTVVVDKGRHRGPIVVETPGITIEGRGGTIVAPRTQRRSSRGLLPAMLIQADGVTVRDMTFVRGGVFSFNDSITVEGCQILRCDEPEGAPTGIEIHGDGARVVDNFVQGVHPDRNWALEGISVLGNDAVVEGNVVQGQHRFLGIGVTGARARVVLNSTSGLQSAGGIVVLGDDALLDSNDVEMDMGTAPGIVVEGDRAVVDGNVVDASLSNGPSLFVDGSDAVVRDNDVTAGAGTGIVAWGDRSRLLDNRIVGVLPVWNGPVIFGHGLVVRGSGNVLDGNFTFATPADGIRVVGGTDNQVDGCDVNSCAGCGLLNVTDDTSVTGSTFLGNGTDVVNTGTFTVFDGNAFSTGSPEGTNFQWNTNPQEDFGAAGFAPGME